MKNYFSGNKTSTASVLSGMDNKQQRFNALVNALYPDIYRYAFWLCNNPTVAEDLVQETYMRAWRSFEHLNDDKAAKAWLITILRRENARMYERYQPDLVDMADLALTDQSAGPAQTMENSLLQKAIAQLEIEFREPLMLQIIGGFSTDEISNILALNKNTVLTRLYRARNKIKDILSDNKSRRGSSNG